ncbi:MAG TPA: VWA domain-containing protein [Thermoanaerobaculia bacterium]|nr:VWA domain-containing protein [Thermoanaerobaculia bacterium]
MPVVATDPVVRLALFINNVKFTEAPGKAMTAQVRVGDYIRRLRLKAAGYDAQGHEIASDEMVVNDPRPPFRVHLSAPPALPKSGIVTMSANVIKPVETTVGAVEFFVGEEKIATLARPPYETSFDASKYPSAIYARVVARAVDGTEANDVVFFGDRPSEQVQVDLEQIPLSVASGTAPLRLEDLALTDNGEPRKIEALVPASDQPLYVILLIDYSESMLEELPVVKAAAKSFARTLLRPQDRIAIVGFNQRAFWLTNWTNDWNDAANAVDRVKPAGETHLYDTAIEMLFELQKTPGRHALVVLTDGVDQGSEFKLEHLIHYARYAGVPVYPIIKNHVLARLMRFGVGYLEARKLANIAKDTGATYFIIKKEAELPAVYQRLANELRQQYQLVFYAPAESGDNWHTLIVTSRAGQQLRAPKGYFP